MFVALGNKYAVNKVINKIINDNAESSIQPVIEKIFVKLKHSQPNLIKKGADLSMIQLKLIDQTKRETENKWIKRVICFGIEKVKLDDVDLAKEELTIEDIFKQKLYFSLKNVSAPSMQKIWYLALLQWISMLFICFAPF